MTPEAESALERIATGDARSAKESMAMAADAAICFANAQGGSIVIGVVDSMAGPSALVGTKLDPLAIKQQIYELSRPPLLVDVAEHPIAGVRLVVVTVPSGVEIHSDTQGRVKHRVGRACLPMTAQHQALRQEERNGIDWSSQASHMSTSDIDPEAVDEARGGPRPPRGERPVYGLLIGSARGFEVSLQGADIPH